METKYRCKDKQCVRDVAAEAEQEVEFPTLFGLG